MQVPRINLKRKTMEQLSKMVNGKSKAKASVWGTALRFQEGKKKDCELKHSIQPCYYYSHVQGIQGNSTLLLYPPLQIFKRYFSRLTSQTSTL